MLWYLVICALMYYPCAIARAGIRSGRKTKHIALMTACVILWFFMALRDVTVGVDTKHYAYVFSQFDEIPFSKVFSAVTYANESENWAFDFEPGYRLVNKLLSMICTAPQTITIFNATVIMVLWYNLIRRESPDFMLSIWMLLTMGIFQTQMNVTRNAIAILLVYNAFGYLRRGRFVPYACVCVFASLFHVAALVFLPVYWLIRRVRPTPEKALTWIGFFWVIGFLFPFIGPYIGSFLPARFANYLQANNEKLQSLMVGFLNGGIFVLTWLLLPRKHRREAFDRCRLGVMMLVINLCFFGMNIGLSYASRMAALFGPYIIILIPRMLTLIPNRTRRRDTARLIMVLCGIQYVLRMCINNIGGTMPYAFFW